MLRKSMLFALVLFALFTVLSAISHAPVSTASAAGCMTRPLKPTLKTPTESKTVDTRRVTLDWNHALCASTYTVVVRISSKQGRHVDGAAGLTTTSFQTRDLAFGHPYYWQVKACNVYGCSKSKKFMFVSVLE